jgi:hypothetical protein
MTKRLILIALLLLTAVLAACNGATDEPVEGIPQDEPMDAMPVEGGMFSPGATANLTATEDPYGIEGIVFVEDDGTLTLRDFVLPDMSGAPLDIRLGLDNAFDNAAVAMMDLTGQTFAGDSVSFGVPAAALAGATYNAVAIVNSDTGEVLDSAVFVNQ